MDEQVSVASAAVKDENLLASLEVSHRQAFALLKLRVIIRGKLEKQSQEEIKHFRFQNCFLLYIGCLTALKKVLYYRHL